MESMHVTGLLIWIFGVWFYCPRRLFRFSTTCLESYSVGDKISVNSWLRDIFLVPCTAFFVENGTLCERLVSSTASCIYLNSELCCLDATNSIKEYWASVFDILTGVSLFCVLGTIINSVAETLLVHWVERTVYCARTSTHVLLALNSFVKLLLCFDSCLRLMRSKLTSTCSVFYSFVNSLFIIKEVLL